MKQVLMGAAVLCFVLIAVFVLRQQSSTPQPADQKETARLNSVLLADYATLPITAQTGGQNTMAQLARVSFMRDEPGRNRFFVSDLNGKLYILDKETRAFTPYLDFNGREGFAGLFGRFKYERNFATGLTNVIFDPDYINNGIFYTLHFEEPALGGSPQPHAAALEGLNVAGYETTAPIPPAPDYVGDTEAEVVLIEWTDHTTDNTTFEGTARELMRVEHVRRIHPMGELSFNPYARAGDPDWRMLYIGVGDASTGDAKDENRLLPQRLDSYYAKVLRILPDTNEQTTTSRLSPNGQYRIPNDNPFAGLPGARGEIWAYGIRNPHRLAWHHDPALGNAPFLFAFNIGATMWETVLIIRKGENYGYPFREGPDARSETSTALPRPDDDVLPIRISGTQEGDNVTPAYPVIAYKTHIGGDAIAGGFIYTGDKLPALKGKLVFGDMTTGRLWYSNLADVFAADDDNPDTFAPIHDLTWDLRTLAEATFKARNGEGDTLPGHGVTSGPGRVDFRFAEDANGEVYVLTKSDGMIREIVNIQ